MGRKEITGENRSSWLVSSVWLLELGKENSVDSGKKMVVGVGLLVTVQGGKESAWQLRSTCLLCPSL